MDVGAVVNFERPLWVFEEAKNRKSQTLARERRYLRLRRSDGGRAMWEEGLT
jgi:hypothetical protein